MLVAVAGTHERTGVSTTALALAAAWPIGQPVILTEADPRGGTLAHRCGGDPGRGLASLRTARTHADGQIGLDLAEHLQWHRAGVAYLAAPAEPATATVLDPLALRPGPGRDWVRAPLILADCGTTTAIAASTPGADLLVLVARARDIEEVASGPNVREAAAHGIRVAMVVIGSEPAKHAAETAVAVLGWLPYAPAEAADLWGGRNQWRASDFGTAAHAVAEALHVALTGTARPVPRRARWPRGNIFRTTRSAPRVYTITSPHPGQPDTVPLAQALAAMCANGEHTRAPSSPGESATSPATTANCADSRPAPVAVPSATLPAETIETAPVLALRLFGPLRVIWRPASGPEGQPATSTEITTRLQPRTRELIAVLATHPDGLSCSQLVEALWGEQCPRNPASAVHTALGRLRAAIAAATDGTVTRPLAREGDRYRLDPAVTTIDYREFRDAVQQRRRANTDAQRRTACTAIIELATPGVLAADLDAGWLAPLREAARRETTTAVGALAQLLVADDPRATLHLLEAAIDNDPYNERLYQDLLRLHARLGEHLVVPTTLALLTQRLAEIGEKPSPETIDLAQRLREEHCRTLIDQRDEKAV